MNGCTRALIAIVLIAGLMYMSENYADHREDHPVLTIGTPSRVALRILACNTRENAQSVIDEHIRGGVQASYARVLALTNSTAQDGNPVCATMVAQVEVKELYQHYSLEFDSGEKPVALVKARVFPHAVFEDGEFKQGMFAPMTVYIALTGVHVLEGMPT